ncbi:MAG TPA: DUF1295 domain-containing protein [Saprospiraceae bacterium]|nr:DUF1295 domain-containing protein [Saprospiraceae bacterium]HMQ81479.1 DUF1295 domain-containing protein [Saprospiraceae bacterium]
MLRTILFLIFTLILVPIFAFYLAEPLSELQQQVLRQLGLIYLGTALTCFLISEWSKNYSQVDKIWSLIPLVYVWLVAYESQWNDRITLMAILVSIWGIRLTFNFARRGGYSWRFWEGEEDYRWAVLRAKPMFDKPWKWSLFNFGFISLYQNGLILLFTLPAVMALNGVDVPLGWVDILLIVVFITFVMVETIADQQQWNYQQEKYRRIQAAEPLTPPYDKGFTHTGLWAYARHPNYAAEQGIWLVFYGFSVVATGLWVNWSIVGALLLLLLFKGSSDFSESISAAKYPDYAAYQSKVTRFVPGLGGFLKKGLVNKTDKASQSV